MKKTTFLLFLALAGLLISCPPEPPPPIIIDPNAPPSKTFLAVDFTNANHQTLYQLSAELLAENDVCTVWVQTGTVGGKDKAQAVANEYKNNIYNKMMDTFGITDLVVNNWTFNTMELADALCNGDGKLCILLLDIKEDRSGGSSYTAGYFDPEDFYSNANSNHLDMLYINTYTYNRTGGEEVVYTTIAHEMQHLMNFATSVAKRYVIQSGGRSVIQMDTWIDEGLSSAAEWLYTGAHVNDRIDWYNTNGRIKTSATTFANRGGIDRGNNFYVWGNIRNYPEEILDEYSTVYLFFQWLRIQTDVGIYKDIIGSSKDLYDAVTDAVFSKINILSAPTDNEERWEYLLKTWLAANYFNNGSGLYGYKGEIPIITTHYIPSTTSVPATTTLLQGEGVYSYVGSTSYLIPSSSEKIRYAGLLLNTSSIATNSSFSNGALLTFNVNTTLYDSTGRPVDLGETGTITGIVPSVLPNTRAAYQKVLTGPFAIGAWDRRGKSKTFTFTGIFNDGNE
jgi:hypothetical protein